MSNPPSNMSRRVPQQTNFFSATQEQPKPRTAREVPEVVDLMSTDEDDGEVADMVVPDTEPAVNVMRSGRISQPTYKLVDRQVDAKEAKKPRLVQKRSAASEVVDLTSSRDEDDEEADKDECVAALLLLRKTASGRTSKPPVRLVQQPFITRKERLGDRAEECILLGPTYPVCRLIRGDEQWVSVFFDEDVCVRNSQYLTEDGSEIGRCLFVNGSRPVGTIVAEFVGNVELESEWEENSYTVELDGDEVLNCLSFSRDAKCIASMANDPLGLHHRDTHAAAPSNCLIVQFTEYPGRVFIVARRVLQDEEAFIDYGDRFGSRTGRDKDKDKKHVGGSSSSSSSSSTQADSALR
jgi:hypothetical protein